MDRAKKYNFSLPDRFGPQIWKKKKILLQVLAVRKNGKLKLTQNTTEVCQYYAFYFKIANPQTHERLWKTLVSDFGPKRKQCNPYPDVYFANAFIGNYLRFELLSRYGFTQQILDESTDYLFYMAERTGTLWENDGVSASCNHGFASHIITPFVQK